MVHQLRQEFTHVQDLRGQARLLPNRGVNRPHPGHTARQEPCCEEGIGRIDVSRHGTRMTTTAAPPEFAGTVRCRGQGHGRFRDGIVP